MFPFVRAATAAVGVALVVLASVAGCAAASAPISTERELVSCLFPARSPQGRLVLEGTAAGPLDDRTREAAFTHALGRKLRELGVEVSSEVRDVRRATSVGTTYDVTFDQRVTQAPVVVRGATLDATCATPDGRRVWARASIPSAEWARLERLARGRTLLVYRCESDPPGACDPALRDRVATAAAAAGLRLLAGEPKGVAPASDVWSPEVLQTIGQSDDAAFVLWVTLRVAFDQASHGEYYSYATAAAALADTNDGGVLRRVDVPRTKGGHYSSHDANRAAVTKAVAALEDDLAHWK